MGKPKHLGRVEGTEWQVNFISGRDAFEICKSSDSQKVTAKYMPMKPMHFAKDDKRLLLSMRNGVTGEQVVIHPATAKEYDKLIKACSSANRLSYSMEKGRRLFGNLQNDPFAGLDQLIGLTDIKQDIRETANFIYIQKKRREKGMNNVPMSMHLVFTGNPGTGKTTVARLLGGIYKEIGVLSKGHLVEVERADLVAGYVGQTAMKTQKKINEALGGILFIDEAYSLTKSGMGNDFGQEAVNTILKAMEDHRDNFVVIVAGYPELMEEFINSNPGLKSRFNKYVNFADYSSDELCQIFRGFCSQYDYKLSRSADRALGRLIDDMVAFEGEEFGNGRTIRNLFEKTIMRQATRVVLDAEDSNLAEIQVEDFPEIPKTE